MSIFYGELDVHEAADLEFFGEHEGIAADFGEDFRRKAERRQGAGGIAGVDAGFLDVLHEAADDVVVAVADAVDVHFGGVAEEAVDEDGVFVGDFDGVLDVVVELGFVGDDFHGAAAEDEGGADENGVADGFGDFAGLFGGAGDAAFGLFKAEFFDHFVEEFAVFGGFDGFDGGADDGDAGVFEGRARGSMVSGHQIGR